MTIPCPTFRVQAGKDREAVAPLLYSCEAELMSLTLTLSSTPLKGYQAPYEKEALPLQLQMQALHVI